MRQEYLAGSAGFILGSLPRYKTKCHQTRSYGALGTEGRRVWRGGAGGDKLSGLSIDLEELHSASRALECGWTRRWLATRGCKTTSSASTAGWLMRIRSPLTSCTI